MKEEIIKERMTVLECEAQKQSNEIWDKIVKITKENSNIIASCLSIRDIY